ncbi:MAG TPA: serine hydrolase, partial [Bacteroidota bacterium]|nr:serine hydrolase [Bacteroidota bacterium]
GKAFEKGLNNRTSAYDLALLFEAIARKKVVSEEASTKMIEILLGQKFNEIIPAKLPQGTKVAHKTGNINGVEHDSGIVFLPDGRAYVLVLLSKDLKDATKGKEILAEVSLRIYRYMESVNRNGH